MTDDNTFLGDWDDTSGMTSCDVEIIEFTGTVDRTVRPLRESIRKKLEEMGIIPRRPPAPDTPSTPPEQPPS